jgi:hypothetical protein
LGGGAGGVAAGWGRGGADLSGRVETAFEFPAGMPRLIRPGIVFRESLSPSALVS